MKTLAAIATAVVLLAWGGAASAFGLLGPPIPEVLEDEAALEVGYENEATKWKPEDAAFDEVSVRRNQAYVQLLGAGISFTELGAAFLRVGGADFDDGASFKDGMKPFGSLGMKEVWYGSRRSRFGIGSIFLANYCTGYEAEKTLSTGTTVTAKIESQWDVGLGVGLQARIGEKFFLYGGPLVVYGNAKVKREGGGTVEKTTYKEKNIPGGFGGIGLSLSKRLVFFVEAQYRSDLSAGASIAWSFE